MEFICETHSSRKTGKGKYELNTNIRTKQGDVTIKEFVWSVKKDVKKNIDEELFEYLKHIVRMTPWKSNKVEGVELDACKIYSMGVHNNQLYVHYDECQKILRKKDQLTLMVLMD